MINGNAGLVEWIIREEKRYLFDVIGEIKKAIITASNINIKHPYKAVKSL